MEIGRVCVKTAGRDAGRVCVVLDNLENNLVLIDGNVRRRKCNAAHLEPLDQVLKVKKGASHTEVAAEFKKLGIPMWETKPKKKSERPMKAKKVSTKPAAEPKAKAEKPKKETNPKAAKPKKAE